ncbi:MAG: hypothetical protein WC551_04575 [Patescibacteria group bacterium]
MTKEHFDVLKQAIEILFQIASIVGVVVLVWYTIETFKIRVTSQNQLRYSSRPFLDFVSDPKPYTILNKSNNVALNVFQFSRIDGRYFIVDEKAIGSALAPNGTIHFDKNASKSISSDELIRRMPELAPLVSYINSKEIISLVIVYEDLLKNKLYTISFGSGGKYDQAAESGYVKDLK